MVILCDTSSILMLIRIAPEMFLDEKFGCCTIEEVRNELVRTQKFQSKYPWRKKYIPKIIPLQLSETQRQEIENHFKAIHLPLMQGVINKNSENLYNLSFTDQKIIASAVAFRYYISTGDNELTTYLIDEFPGYNLSNISPLGLINKWLQKKLIVWNDDMQKITQNWENCLEHYQPIDEIAKFEKLTGYKYNGS